MTAGLVLLLFVVYELWFTDVVSGIEQQHATDDLDRLWSAPGPALADPYEGQGFAKLHLPTLDEAFTVVEGTTPASLAIGPGHYDATALPGRPGNMGIAGHRVGRGAPFLDLGELQSCDAVVMETATDWFVYRILPMDGEVAGWATGRGTRPQCEGVGALPSPYRGVVGREIVDPSRVDVVGLVPGVPGATVPADERAALITLTTCHPKFSARQRMILHGVLVKSYPKDPANPRTAPPELDAA